MPNRKDPITLFTMPFNPIFQPRQWQRIAIEQRGSAEAGIVDVVMQRAGCLLTWLWIQRPFPAPPNIIVNFTGTLFRLRKANSKQLNRLSLIYR